MTMCYPATADWSCAGTPAEIADLNPAIKERSEMLAWNSLARLTGFRLSLCPTTVRPCATGCNPGIWTTAPVNGWTGYGPYISGGIWYNACGCRPNACSCTTVQELVLPDPEVSGPIVVTLNGAVMDTSAYRVDNGNRLVRQDGEAWPLCQDMNAAIPEFSVSYYAGVGPDDALNFAAGMLAAEWYKACQGRDCRLPSTITQVVRQGVTFTIPSFDSGTSGILEVDNIVANYNPFHLKVPSRVISPDSLRARRRTA